MKDKIINFLLIFLLVFLAINFFTWKDDEKVKENTIKLSTQEDYTIPASIKLNVTNDTLEDFSFNTCDNIYIKKDSTNITSNECINVTLKSGEKYVLDFSKEYDKFSSVWEYFAVLKSGDIDIISKFQIDNKWFFKKFFIFFFYAPIYNLTTFLLQITWYSLGWAIILVTIIIRIILIYPQHKMMVSQKKMQKVQPKIKEIQEKHKWDHATLWQELMKLYKEEQINPFGSFWLLFIQMPILIVMYHVILSIEDYSNMYYLYSFVSDFSVSMINNIFYWFNLLWIWWINWLVLALIVWALQFIQVKLSLWYNKDEKKTWVVLEKKKEKKEYESFMPDPELMNKFMLYWLPIIIAISTYSFFAWVWLYWWISTLFTTIQQLFVNKILKK